eukprot:435529-Prymnesium_polylepis.1
MVAGEPHSLPSGHKPAQSGLSCKLVSAEPTCGESRGGNCQRRKARDFKVRAQSGWSWVRLVWAVRPG